MSDLGDRMNTEPMPRDHARRNRTIAIAAGVVTVTAIVLGFASEFLGVPWHWMRPAAELLLLAELVGLVVLERHQLFEPVHEQVGSMTAQMTDMRQTLNSLSEHARASGQLTICADPPEVLRTQARVTREALARDHESPQILRVAALSSRPISQERWDLGSETRGLGERDIGMPSSAQ